MRLRNQVRGRDGALGEEEDLMIPSRAYLMGQSKRHFLIGGCGRIHYVDTICSRSYSCSCQKSTACPVQSKTEALNNKRTKGEGSLVLNCDRLILILKLFL